MDRSTNHIVKSIGFRLLGHLDTYTDLMRDMAECWPMEDLQVSALMDQMRTEAMTVPELRVAWVDFIISHADTVQSFWSLSEVPPRLDRLEVHVAKVLDLQSKCLQVATGRQILL